MNNQTNDDLLSKEELTKASFVNSPDMIIVRRYITDLEDIGIITLLTCMNQARSDSLREVFKELDEIFLDDKKSLTPITYGAYQATKKKYLKS